MKRWKALLRPPLPWALASVVAGAPALAAALTGFWSAPWLVYPAYALSAYAVLVWSIRIPGAVRSVRAAVRSHRLGGRYLEDLPFRGRVSLAVSAAVNALYALCKLAAGITYHSFWFGAIAVYYLLLAATRGYLLRRSLRSAGRLQEYRVYRACGWLLLVLNLALSAVVAQMVTEGKGYRYPGHLIFAAALYAFYAAAMAVVNLVRFRRLNSPVLSASKLLGLATALVSLLSLQTAMFAAFGESFLRQRQMNALTGGAVCLLLLAMAVYMVVHAGRRLRQAAHGAEALKERNAYGAS